jgi:Ca2+-binding EF-hand superfamily protein
MSTLGAVGGASSAWADFSASRASAMKEKRFARVDTDGNGSVNQAELQTLFDKIAKKTGTTAADAATQLKKMDSNGDGSLSSDELAAGMKSLMPQPRSTVDFAQRHASAGKGAGGGHGGPPPAGRGGDGDGDDGGAASSTHSSSSAATDPLDTNGDGAVSAQERAAGALKNLVRQAYTQATTNASPTATANLSLAA